MTIILIFTEYFLLNEITEHSSINIVFDVIIKILEFLDEFIWK